MDSECRMQDAGFRMQDAGYRMQNSRYRMQDTGSTDRADCHISRASCILHLVSCIPYPASCILFTVFLLISCKDPTREKPDFPSELVEFLPYKRNPVFSGTGINTWDEEIRERG